MLRTEDIYEEILRDHQFFSKSFKKPILDGRQSVKGSNFSCGDTIQIDFSVRNDVLLDISFKGNICALVKASASLMADELKGKTFIEAMQLCNTVEKLVLNNTYGNRPLDQLIKKLGETYPSTSQHSYGACVILPWKTLKNAIQKNKILTQGLEKDYSLYLY